MFKRRIFKRVLLAVLAIMCISPVYEYLLNKTEKVDTTIDKYINNAVNKTYGKQVYYDSEDISNILSYTFTCNDFSEIDELLEQQKYVYVQEVTNYEYIAVITYEDTTATVNQYKVEYNEAVDITVPEDSTFIISFYAPTTVTWDWTVLNELSLLQYSSEDTTRIDIYKQGDEGVVGGGYERQNLYFTTTEVGEEQVEIAYISQDESQYSEDRLVKVNVTVE